MKEMTAAEYNAMVDREMLEATWQSHVLAQAKVTGWRRAHFRAARVKIGGHETYRTPVQGDGKGFPDLLMTNGTGLLVVEVKREKGKLDPEQIVWLDAFAACGIETAVWRPSDRDLVWARLGDPGWLLSADRVRVVKLLAGKRDHAGRPTWRAWERLHGHEHEQERG